MSWHLRAETGVDAPPQTAWSVLVDVDAYPAWNPTLRVWGDLAEGERPWAMLVDRDLPPAVFRPRVTHLDPGREVRWRTRFPLGAVTATHTFRVDPANGAGARFVQAERFDGVLADPLLERLSTAVRRSFERMNAALAERAATLSDSPGDYEWR